MHIIAAKNLCKIIGKATVLDNVNLDLKSGEIVGIAGKNGSGKTMLFRALAGLIKPSKGEIRIDGQLLHKDIHFPQSLGLVLENINLYPEFTALENLIFLSMIRKKIKEDQIRYTLERIGLDPTNRKPVRKYSLGMRQRLALAQALMETPDFLFLDEPTNGLDESGIDLIQSILKEESQRGALVLIASHNKEDLSTLSDITYHMSDGKLYQNYP